MTTAIVILILVLVVAMMLRHLVRTFFYPYPRALPGTVEESVAAMLMRFEQALAKHAPDVVAGLQPGLSDERIREIESRYRLPLPDDLRALYRWRNGSVATARSELIPGHSFVPLEQAAEQRETMQRQVAEAPLAQRAVYWVVAGHRTTWLTILDDGCGDGYFYDPSPRRTNARFFYHFAEDRQYRFFPSFANFLAGAIECYETGIYRSARRAGHDENFERSFELWRRYAEWPGA